MKNKMRRYGLVLSNCGKSLLSCAKFNSLCKLSSIVDAISFLWSSVTNAWFTWETKSSSLNDIPWNCDSYYQYTFIQYLINWQITSSIIFVVYLNNFVFYSKLKADCINLFILFLFSKLIKKIGLTLIEIYVICEVPFYK